MTKGMFGSFAQPRLALSGKDTRLVQSHNIELLLYQAISSVAGKGFLASAGELNRLSCASKIT